MQLCAPCGHPLDLEDVDGGLSFFGRALAKQGPVKAWEMAADIVMHNVTHITHCHLIAGANAVLALIHQQGSADTTAEQRDKAGVILGHLHRVATVTKEQDPYPDCSESELLLALTPPTSNVVGEQSWTLPGIQIVSFEAGDEVDQDVIVVDDEEDGVPTRSLVLGAFQLDGFRESEIPLEVLAGIQREEPGAGESMLCNWVNRGFGSFVRLQPRGRRFLLLGVGGGTLAHLVLQTCPEASIDAVEWSRPVMNAARQHFGLDERRYGARLQLHHSEAEEFLRQCSEENKNSGSPEMAQAEGKEGLPWVWDAVLVDLYSNDALPPNCITRGFLELAYSLTRGASGSAGAGKGMVAFNCGRELDEYPELCENAESLDARGPDGVDGLHVCVIHPQDEARPAPSATQGELVERHVDSESQLENRIDNALLLLVGAESEAAASKCARRIATDAGSY